MNRVIYRFLLKNPLATYAVSFAVGWSTLFLTSDMGDDAADYYVLFASPLAFGATVLLTQNVVLDLVWGDTAHALGALPLERKHFARFLWWMAVVGPPTFCGLGVGVGLALTRRDFTYTVPTVLWILACQWVFAAGCAAAASFYASGKANRSVCRNNWQRFIRAAAKFAGWSSPVLVLGGGVLAAYLAARPNAFVFILLAWSAALMILSYHYCDRTWYPSVEARTPSTRRLRFRYLLVGANPALPIARWYSPLVYSMMVTTTVGCLVHPYWTGDARFEVAGILGPLTLVLGITYMGEAVPFDNRILRALPVSRNIHVLILLSVPIILFAPSLIVLISLQVSRGWGAPRSLVSFLAAFSLHCAYIAATTRLARVWCQFPLWFGALALFIFAFQSHIEPHIFPGIATAALVALCVAYAFLYRAIGHSDAMYPRRIPYETYNDDWI